MKPIRLLSGFLTVGMWTLLSRVLGFVRDILIAGFLGAGPVAEAFLVAFALPNMFRRFFAEGAFNTAFVPLFSKKLETGGDPQGFARDAFSGLAGVLILFTLLAQLIMPWLVLAMAGGFAGDGRLDLAVDYGRVAFPYILLALAIVAALGPGLMNALIAVAAVNIPFFARNIRGITVGIAHKEFVDAARLSGMKDARIILSEVLPNVIPVIVIAMSTTVG